MADATTGKEYIVLETSTFNHDVNQQTCADLGAQLPEPRDEHDNLFIDSLGSEMLVLGINDNDVEHQWVYDSDGSPVSYTSWGTLTDYPPNPYYNTGDNCVGMYRNHNNDLAGQRSQDWFDFNCNSKPFFEGKSKSLICERSEYIHITAHESI